MCHRCDGTDHAERRMFNDCQPMVATEGFGAQELNTRRAFAERLQFFNLVLQSADLRFFHLHRAELNTLVDRDAANMRYDATTFLDGARRKLFKGIASCRSRLLHVREYSIASRISRFHRW